MVLGPQFILTAGVQRFMLVYLCSGRLSMGVLQEGRKGAYSFDNEFSDDTELLQGQVLRLAIDIFRF